MTVKIESDRQLAEFRNEVERYAKKTFERGLMVESKGFLSLRTADEKILITPPDLNLQTLTPQIMFLYEMDGNRLSPTDQTDEHADISFVINTFKVRQDVSAMGHFHPRYATQFSMNERSIPFVLDNTEKVLREILWVRCKTCLHRYEGLCQCFEGQRKSYAGVNNLLLENDGIITMGKDLPGVIEVAMLMEANAEAAYQLVNTADDNEKTLP